MKTNVKRIATEMAAIILMGTLIGIAWNHRLLKEVFLGQGIQPKETPPVADTTTPTRQTPLPLGLMQVKELFDTGEALIIDARDLETFRRGHIRGAISIPVGEAEGLIPSLAERIPKEKLLVVYCGGYDCHDSRLLGEKLMNAGFTQVFVYEGGYPEWKDGGHPVAEGVN